ncbi:hypothetical protein J1605_017006 [Eschrichtius robustus]|uniref:Uncharacterized protein n=1 Tax=Eschrichtius robustus TaxID=9764 RepID=A0AB34I2M0_ESCRO|nr:hypothetical protein J1605_017006 [Eschrichtius robustus]
MLRDNRFLKHCGIQGSIMESRSHQRFPWKEAWRTLVQLPTEARGLEMGRWSGRHRFSIFKSCKFKTGTPAAITYWKVEEEPVCEHRGHR